MTTKEIQSVKLIFDLHTFQRNREPVLHLSELSVLSEDLIHEFHGFSWQQIYNLSVWQVGLQAHQEHGWL